MIRGIYTAAVSMMARKTQQEIIANNLANVNTAGYKRDRMQFRNTLDAKMLINQNPQVTPVEGVQTDFSQGRLSKTDDLYDFALETPGFFVIEGPNGRYYTRNGHFTLTESGELVAANGIPVLGESGPITLPEGKFSVNANGEIIVNNEVLNKFLVAQFQQPAQALRKVGNNLYEARQGTAQPEMVDGRIRQGYLESSNVNVVEEMVDMILAFRDFAANQKTIQTQDETLRRAVTDLGRV
ncbi:MAG: flagellar basal-body rod protein FlgF [Calditrichaeota bacterium]|nr:MAG: flagellar basal-body rod protein FlgF [Calditrichota bacterium]